MQMPAVARGRPMTPVGHCTACFHLTDSQGFESESADEAAAGGVLKTASLPVLLEVVSGRRGREIDCSTDNGRACLRLAMAQGRASGLAAPLKEGRFFVGGRIWMPLSESI
jgi:hypothetical protein